MNKTICSIAFAVALLSTQADAHCCNSYNGGNNFGAALGYGILGGMIGQALVQPPPSQVVIVPQYIQPQPYIVPMPSSPTLPMYQQRQWWCAASGRWYPDVVICNTPWSR